MLALLGEAQHDPAVRAALLERVIHPRRDASARAIREAQVRGELCADVHPHVAVDLIYGPVFYRLAHGARAGHGAIRHAGARARARRARARSLGATARHWLKTCAFCG
ncbi:TetR-like C-terminal domain-containing protein [Gemmatirosa kalamazoonensis]|uniref:TetR-like C-terminal domain-containing protein n=1 Tax=Gemmatirosa kalamazoonensis TaxID=861299 RepID=UPI0004B78F3C